MQKYMVLVLHDTHSADWNDAGNPVVIDELVCTESELIWFLYKHAVYCEFRVYQAGIGEEWTLIYSNDNLSLLDEDDLHTRLVQLGDPGFAN